MHSPPLAGASRGRRLALDWLPSLSVRDLQGELMDQPGIDAEDHRQALAGLRRINRVSGSVRILWPAIRRLARERGAGELSVLDVASGGGDVPLGLWHKAQRAGLRLRIVGCDISPLAVELASVQALASGADVRFQTHDVVRNRLPAGFDVVMCSLFLHHLPRMQATALLRNMQHAASHLVLVQDVRRSLGGYMLAQAACRLLSRSGIVHVDGPRSVAGAFTVEEVRGLCARAGLEGATVRNRWPFRFLASWRKQPSAEPWSQDTASLVAG